jgi:hypothetical protein
MDKQRRKPLIPLFNPCAPHMPSRPTAEQPIVPCPGCGRLNNATSDIGGKRIMPKHGDIGMCFGCTVFTIFDNGVLRLLTPDEFVDLPADERGTLIRIRNAIRTLHKTREGET